MDDWKLVGDVRFLTEASGLGRLNADVNSCSTDGRFDAIDADDALHLFTAATIHRQYNMES